jgi:hypothetical protein
MLLWTNGTAPRHAWIVPALWVATGTVGALQLGVADDPSLVLSLAVVAFTRVASRQKVVGFSRTEVTGSP